MNVNVGECKLWNDLKDYCQCSFDLPISNPQSAASGFFEIDPDLFVIFDHILSLYKYYIFPSRDSSKLSITALLKNIKNVFDLGKKISTETEGKTKAFIKKWSKMMQLVYFVN